MVIFNSYVSLPEGKVSYSILRPLVSLVLFRCILWNILLHEISPVAGVTLRYSNMADENPPFTSVIFPFKPSFIVDFPMQMFPYFFHSNLHFLWISMASEPQPWKNKRALEAHPWGPCRANQHAILEALQPSKGLMKSRKGGERWLKQAWWHSNNHQKYGY